MHVSEKFYPPTAARYLLNSVQKIARNGLALHVYFTKPSLCTICSRFSIPSFSCRRCADMVTEQDNHSSASNATSKERRHFLLQRNTGSADKLLPSRCTAQSADGAPTGASMRWQCFPANPSTSRAAQWSLKGKFSPKDHAGLCAHRRERMAEAGGCFHSLEQLHLDGYSLLTGETRAYVMCGTGATTFLVSGYRVSC